MGQSRYGTSLEGQIHLLKEENKIIKEIKGVEYSLRN